MNKDKLVLLCGMPCSGKGEMSNLLKQESNFEHISISGLLRSLDPNSPLGKKVHDLQNRGILVDPDTMSEVLEPKIKHGCNLVFDGHPRTIPQLEWLMPRTKDFDLIGILLEVDEATATTRRNKRLAEMISSGQEPRKDDIDPISVTKRLAEYREKTVPTIEFLSNKLGDKFYSIDTNNRTIEEVFSIVADILGIKKRNKI